MRKLQIPILGLACLLAFGPAFRPQDTQEVQEIKWGDIAKESGKKNKVIVGFIHSKDDPNSKHGHLVFVVPGTNGQRPRVYDGNILGALIDLKNRKAISLTMKDKLRMFLTETYDNKRKKRHHSLHSRKD